MIFGRVVKLPDGSPEQEKVSDNWKNRQRYVHKCKKQLRKDEFMNNWP